MDEAREVLIRYNGEAVGLEILNEIETALALESSVEVARWSDAFKPNDQCFRYRTLLAMGAQQATGVNMVSRLTPDTRRRALEASGFGARLSRTFLNHTDFSFVLQISYYSTHAAFPLLQSFCGRIANCVHQLTADTAKQDHLHRLGRLITYTKSSVERSERNQLVRTLSLQSVKAEVELAERFAASPATFGSFPRHVNRIRSSHTTRCLPCRLIFTSISCAFLVDRVGRVRLMWIVSLTWRSRLPF